MKKDPRWIVGAFALFFLLSLGYKVPKYFNPGVYYFEEKTNWAPFSGIQFNWRQATVSSVAPQEIEVPLDLSQAKKVIYASFELGNNKQVVYLAGIVNSKGNLDRLYVDLNNDLVLDESDKVAVNFQEEEKGTKYRSNASPLRTLVSYKNAAGKEIKKYLHFDVVMEYNDRAQKGMIYYRVRSWFFGECRFDERKIGQLPVKIAIVDANNDGIFGDYDQDLLFVDINYNGIFEKGEKADIKALFYDKDKTQYRNYIFSWPYCLAVVPISEWKDSSIYEPKDDTPQVVVKAELVEVNPLDHLDMASLLD